MTEEQKVEEINYLARKLQFMASEIHCYGNIRFGLKLNSIAIQLIDIAKSINSDTKNFDHD